MTSEEFIQEVMALGATEEQAAELLKIADSFIAANYLMASRLSFLNFVQKTTSTEGLHEIVEQETT